MPNMTLKEVQELIKLVAKTELSEFKYKDDQVSLQIRGKSYQASADANGVAAAAPSIINVPAPAMSAGYPPAPQAPAPAVGAPTEHKPAPAAGGAEKEDAKLIQVKSPMIGTFYRSSSPDKPPYVKVGDRVAKGDTVCIVEAMKLFNEIESEVSGKIVKVLVEDAQPIEYDQPLFLVDPS